MTAPPLTDGARCPQLALPSSLHDWALFLDVDGTLLDIAPAPDAVVVPPILRAALDILQPQLSGALALLSGRALSDLDQLFAPLRLAGAGLHGAEWRDAHGAHHRAEMDTEAMDEARRRAYQLTADLTGVVVEDKGMAIALHWRHAPACEDPLRSGVEAIARVTGVAVQPGKCVFELKPAGVNKGIALQKLSEMPTFAGRRPLFIGDDLTDAFAIEAAQRLGGLGVAVGPTLADIADFVLADPAAVRAQLMCWSEGRTGA